jgi:hypothetical protein
MRVLLGFVVISATWYVRARSVLERNVYRDLNAAYSLHSASSWPEDGTHRSLKGKLDAVSAKYGSVDSFQIGHPGISEALDHWSCNVKTMRRGQYLSEQVICFTSNDKCTVYVGR